MTTWIVHHVDAETDVYFGPFTDAEEAKGKALASYDDCISTTSWCEVTLIPVQGDEPASA